MDDLLADEKVGQLVQGEVAEGTVMSVRKHEVLIDLGPLGVGFVPRREIGFGQKNRVIKLLKKEGFYINKIQKDLSKIDRCIICTKI